VKVILDVDLDRWIGDEQLGEAIADEVRAAVRAEVRRMAKAAIEVSRAKWQDQIAAKVAAALAATEP
jgi:hypothetical protein